MVTKKTQEAEKSPEVAEVAEVAKVEEKVAPPPKAVVSEEKYFWVIFNPKTSEYDTEKVLLTVNGEQLVITRGKEVPVPERYLECARHTTRPVYRQDPGKDRKIVSYVSTYSYNVVREATEEEFEQEKSKGNKIQRDEIARQEQALGG